MRYTPTETEMLELLNKPDTSTLKGIRDKAMLELLYSSALRRSELADINIDHVNLIDRTIRIVKGKNNKDRYIPMTKKACEALKTYLERCRPLYNRDPAVKTLFLGEWGRRISPGMVNEIVHEYADFNSKISAHSIRHAVATHMLKRGANIMYLQKLLGHSSPKTTEIYTHLYPKDLVQIYGKFHPRK